MAAAAAGVAMIGAAVSPAVAALQAPSGHQGGFDPAAALHPPDAGTQSTSGGHAPTAGHGTGAGDTAPLAKAITTVRRQAARAAAERASRRHRHKHHATVSVVYENPLRGIVGLIPERLDMGVDFGGTGPIYAIGDGVITNATGSSGGWPGGGWITYQLTDGPAAGLTVYVAEDVTPTVSVGQQVTPNTVIANMWNGGSGIETGWAMPDGASAESQLGEAGGISGGGPFPTDVGTNFDELLQALGVPAAPGYGGASYGVLPSRYPTAWASFIGA
jgi:murein DD-endopeptidase MepM/ murein hydrolase activator NlpD